MLNPDAAADTTMLPEYDRDVPCESDTGAVHPETSPPPAVMYARVCGCQGAADIYAFCSGCIAHELTQLDALVRCEQCGRQCTAAEMVTWLGPVR